MNKKLYILPALMLTLAAPAGAHLFKVGGVHDADGTVVSREGKANFSVKKAKGKAASAVAKTLAYAGPSENDIAKYGTLTEVFSEDFSKMSAGSIEEPETSIDLCIDWQSPEFEYPWWNLKPEFTNAPHWGAGAEEPGKCGQAGGAYYMEMAETPMGGCTQAHINTPNLKVDGTGGPCVFEFKARTKNAGETYDWLLVEAAETNDMAPSWRDVDEQVLVNGITDQWQTYRFVYRDGGPTTIFNIIGIGPGNVYIDDVKAYTLTPKVMYPTTLPHSEYQGTSFTANWYPVEGADSYLLSVYSLNDDGSRAYAVEDKKVEGTSQNVTGLDNGEIYYYTVKAVKGSDVSLESYATRVYALVPPTMKQPDIINGWTYKANWTDVPGADVYNYIAYGKRVATEDGPFVVTFEDFTDIVDFDGNKTGLTKEDPSVYTISGQFFPTTLKQQGWYGEASMPYEDYMAFDAFHYETGASQAGFFSPDLDLSKDGGKFTIECDLAAETDDEGRVTSCVVAIFNYDELTQDYRQDELIYIDEELNLDWQHIVFEPTTGTEHTIIGICAIRSYSNLYLDNLKVTQNYKAGEYLMDPFQYTRWHGRNETDIPNQLEVVVAPHAQTLDIYHQVSAYGRQVDERNQVYDDRESKFSPIEFVMSSESGVEGIESDAVEAAPVYFTIAGQQVSAKDLTPGIYVVRRGAKVTTEVIK